MILEVNNLSKSFGNSKAVDNLSFSVEKGELFAFLGENGAGKSTTINIICGELEKDSGTVTVAGYDTSLKMNAIRKKLGVVFQNSVLDKALSVTDNLESRAALYGITGKEFKSRIQELAKMLHFEKLLSRPVGKLSGGERRRADIARALFHHPEILILDEPTTGLDPQTRKTLWSVIASLQKEEKMTVFLTTHYMEEAAEADHVLIIDGGKQIAKGTPLELKNKYTGDFILLYGVDDKTVEKLGLPYERVKNCFRISVPNTAKATELILKYPEVFNDYEITKGKMDDVFLSVTGKKLMGVDEK